jgi:hypothetical protein
MECLPIYIIEKENSVGVSSNNLDFPVGYRVYLQSNFARKTLRDISYVRSGWPDELVKKSLNM